jgi:cation transport regulator ChaC
VGEPAYVFAYASLLETARDGETIASLRGYVRAWNVAMDNSATIPGYKYFVAPDGTRPRIFVAFLNLVAADASVNGVAFPVDARELALLDERERNYGRVDVGASVEPRLDAPVWTYVGLDEARGRFELGRRERRCAVSRAYHERVLDGFRARGMEDEFRRTTRPPECPLHDLKLVAVPSR